jgi:hypothetical protein
VYGLGWGLVMLRKCNVQFGEMLSRSEGQQQFAEFVLVAGTLLGQAN